MNTIREYFKAIPEMINNVPANTPEYAAMIQTVGAGLSVLLANQTADERANKSTQHLNGKGFNGRDAAFGTSMAEFFARRGFLSPKQLVFGAKMCVRYVRQIEEGGVRCPGVELYGE